jgi:transcriptional regulator with XRE-family HTH domain
MDPTDNIQTMAPEELERLMAALKAWCKEKRGRQRQIVKELGITESMLSNWLARREDPSLANYFRLREFLEKQRRRKK